MLHLKPLSPGFGLEASGIDLSERLSDEAFVEIEDAFFDGQVLSIPHQRLTPAEFVAFARRFGPPEPHVIDQFHHPDDRNILILSNVVIDGEPQGLADAGTYFHTDYSYLDVPARATMLYSIEVPESGGDTLFANQYAAYDNLPAAMKRKIEPLVAVHHYGNRHVSEGEARTGAHHDQYPFRRRIAGVLHDAVAPAGARGQRVHRFGHRVGNLGVERVQAPR